MPRDLSPHQHHGPPSNGAYRTAPTQNLNLPLAPSPSTSSSPAFRSPSPTRLHLPSCPGIYPEPHRLLVLANAHSPTTVDLQQGMQITGYWHLCQSPPTTCSPTLVLHPCSYAHPHSPPSSTSSLHALYHPSPSPKPATATPSSPPMGANSYSPLAPPLTPTLSLTATSNTTYLVSLPSSAQTALPPSPPPP